MESWALTRDYSISLVHFPSMLYQKNVTDTLFAAEVRPAF